MNKFFNILLAFLAVLCVSQSANVPLSGSQSANVLLSGSQPANVPLSGSQPANVPLSGSQPANVPLSGSQSTNVLIAEKEQESQARNIQVVQDINVFIKQNPHLRIIRLNKKVPVNHSQSVKYSLGNRVSGDRMVAQYADTFFYPALKDVSTQVTYPETGTGSVVTSIDINCLQDNTDGNAYVVAGGIGQRFISIVLEGKQTERFSYNIHVYGKN